MDRRELLRKITSFPITASGLAEDLLSGDYRSVFKGQGIEFDEARHYEIGDDVRSIDWNASARFGVPYVKMYREERELTVFIILDTSASMHTGGQVPEKAKAAAGLLNRRSMGRTMNIMVPMNRFEQGSFAAALVAFSAEEAGQRVGALFFDREITRIFPPKKGRRHILGILGAAVGIRSGGRGSDLGTALAGAGRLLKRRSLVVVISDFFSAAIPAAGAGWEEEIGDLARKHDVIALNITDPLDTDFPDAGFIPMEDPETGIKFHAASGFPSFRSHWSRWHEDRARHWDEVCRRAGAARLSLSIAADAPAVLVRFFKGRNGPGRSSGPGRNDPGRSVRNTRGRP
ncbi:hypothetical protein AGMMS49546_01030 [Spirochaetia bacterium]|nr:hypothetical protein AGMMS49546_01030 [Spirochaetia bacterium]